MIFRDNVKEKKIKAIKPWAIFFRQLNTGGDGDEEETAWLHRVNNVVNESLVMALVQEQPSINDVNVTSCRGKHQVAWWKPE